MASQLTIMPELGSRFLDLPGELRAMIYDRTLIHKRKLEGDQLTEFHVRLRVRDVPNPSMLRVSRQIRNEYLYQLQKYTTLVCVQRPKPEDNDPVDGPLEFPERCAYIRRAELHFAVDPYMHPYLSRQGRLGPSGAEANGQKEWVEFILGKLPYLEDIDITLVIDADDKNALAAPCPQAHSEFLLALPNVRKVTTYMSSFCTEIFCLGICRWDLRKERVKLTKTNAKGVIVRVDDQFENLPAYATGYSDSTDDDESEDGEIDDYHLFECNCGFRNFDAENEPGYEDPDEDIGFD